MLSHVKQWIYAILAIAGIIVPWYFNLRFMQQHNGFSFPLYLQEVYANWASSSFGSDLFIAVAAFLVWLFAESRRLEIRWPWLYVLLTFGIAFAFAFPLFLLVRERRLAELAGISALCEPNPELRGQ